MKFIVTGLYSAVPAFVPIGNKAVDAPVGMLLINAPAPSASIILVEDNVLPVMLHELPSVKLFAPSDNTPWSNISALFTVQAFVRLTRPVELVLDIVRLFKISGNPFRLPEL